MVIFGWAFVAFAASIGAWTLATPLMAAPDEPNHVVESAAAVRGEIYVAKDPRSKGITSAVTVPRWVADGESVPGCYAFKDTVSAACAPRIGSGTQPTVAETQFSNYPQLYYFLTGLPSLVLIGSHGVYAMEFAAVIICAALLALGVFALARYHPRRMPLVGPLVAVVPMVLFLASVDNSSGMEITAGFAAWCTGLCVVEYDVVPRALAVLTAVAFGIFILSRPLSPVSAAGLVVVLALLAGWRRSRALVAARSFRPVLTTVVATMVLSGLLLVVGGTPVLLKGTTNPHYDLIRSVWVTLLQTHTQIWQSIGWFGWVDTLSPYGVYLAWYVLVPAFCITAMIVSPRCRRALPVLALMVVALPVVFQGPKLDTAGIYWQGRYTLPLALGLPLVAATLERRRAVDDPVRAHRPPVTVRAVGLLVLAAVVVTAQIAAFLTALHRYQTGLGAAPGTPVRWVPPGGVVLVVTLLIVGQALVVGLIAWRTLRPEDRAILPEELPVPAYARV